MAVSVCCRPGQVGQGARAFQLLRQPGQYLAWGQQPHRGGREFQRQRQAVEPAAELGHRLSVLAGQGEPGLDITDPVDKQPHRWVLRQCLEGDPGRRNAQRVHPPFLLTADPQYHPAGHQHPQARRRLEQVRDHGRGVQHLLEVIQNDQHVPVGQTPFQGVQRPLLALSHQAERRGDRVGHERRITDRGQVDERRAVGPLPPGAPGHRQRQPRLTRPARPGQHHQPAPRRGQHLGYLLHVAVPVHQRCHRQRDHRQPDSAVPGTEPLSEQGRQVTGDQLTQLGGIGELLIGQRALGPDPVEHPLQARFHPGGGDLDIQQPRHASGQPQLVLQAGDVHAGPDPAITLPVDPHENVGLLQVGPVHRLRRVRPRPRLEHHRRQPQLLDRPPHHAALGGQFLQR